MAQIIHGKPPIFDEAAKLFGVTEDDVVFYSWGDTIYSPTGKVPSDDLLIHEATHANQQSHDPIAAKIWWDKFMVDPEWRIEQEAEAFGEQLRWIRGRVKDRNTIARYVHQMSSSLASKMYGKAISYQDAMKKIKSYADGSAISDIEELMAGDDNPATA